MNQLEAQRMSTARRLEVGHTVSLDGILFKVIRRPFGSARLDAQGHVIDEEVTLTLERGPDVDKRFAR